MCSGAASEIGVERVVKGCDCQIVRAGKVRKKCWPGAQVSKFCVKVSRTTPPSGSSKY